MKISLTILLFIIISCKSQKTFNFPLTLNSEMTKSEVEQRLQVALVRIPGFTYLAYSLPPTEIEYEVKRDFEIDYLKFKDVIISFDTSRNAKLCEIRFQHSDIAYTFNPVDERLNFKKQIEKNGYVYLAKKHVELVTPAEDKNNMIGTTVDYYLKENIFVRYEVNNKFQTLKYTLINESKKLSLENDEKAYKTNF